MQAIIMAAGKGSRLGNLTQDMPKSFLEIQGIKLIEYNIALLHAYGIKDIVIVTGYQCERIEELVKDIEGIRCIYNPFYEMVNVLGSFYMAQEYLHEDTVYMHADTLCAPEIFETMLKTDGDMVLPVEYKVCDEEAMKVRTEAGRIVEISKQISCEVGEGEFIGILKIGQKILPDLRRASKDVLKNKEFSSYFEGAVQKLIDWGGYEFIAVSTENHFWGEIDFLEDYERACDKISRKLIDIAQKEWR